MSDILDETDEREAAFLAAEVLRVRLSAAAIPAGEPGDCDFCGEWTGRLVRGACAPCRDKRGLA